MIIHLEICVLDPDDYSLSLRYDFEFWTCRRRQSEVNCLVMVSHVNQSQLRQQNYLVTFREKIKFMLKEINLPKTRSVQTVK